jgi:hypothetical protein
VASWGLVGGGAAALAAGGVLGALALGDRSDYMSLPQKDVGDRYESRALAADVLLSVGAAAVIGGLVVRHLTAPRSRADVSVTEAP